MELLSSFFSGKAIKHVQDSLFTAESGNRRGIPKVIVVITDGRSQDDVNKISRDMQSNGKFYIDKQQWIPMIMFALLLSEYKFKGYVSMT